MSKLDEAVRLHNDIVDLMVALECRMDRGELHRLVYETEYDRLSYALDDLKRDLRKSLTRTKDPATLLRRLKSSKLKAEFMYDLY